MHARSRVRPRRYVGVPLPGTSLPQIGLPSAGIETNFLFSNRYQYLQSSVGACPKGLKSIGPADKPLSVQSDTLRRFVMNEERVGF